MLVVIPARGGSKRVPGKNIKELGGKPLIQYTIDAAREIFEDKDIIISTDSEKIKTSVERLGLKVPFLRPAELATDESGTQDVLMHALSFVESKGFYPQTLILLQPTSPFRNASHIREALKLYNNKMDMVVSVKETTSNPYYLLKEEDELGFLENSKNAMSLTKRQLPKVWELNGAIYVINVNSLKKGSMKNFKKTKKYVMDDLSSIDIDMPLDWLLAEVILRNDLISK
jgi:N-acylneuraminate cytidylyltransferase